ncbi:transcriptional regulator, TetR family [Saccharopolyspora shandongensis]|uniref:Transcriptional regulator, TetR family n=1 Tax=Saccharopolyspora shandongensis TaxID=418495 RepID=A0A1H2V2C6_9PSEU|nr:TetR/AcrR family transcriptional regulator [Saccharopolyspora shandongensis]SDW62478.1 transcriptional regulator, TetR family [Saccharopolyspora shandongensis]
MDGDLLRPNQRGRERADAARNRAHILAAAEELFATRSAQSVTMEDIAKAAGVGRATLYRRYPDRASIATALLDEHERALQEKLLRGDPPLGPGAPPAERLAAFYEAMVDLLERHIHLVLGTEVGRSRFETGAYGFWRAHVRSLLAESSLADPESLTDSLLAPLAPEVFRHQHETLGMEAKRIKAALAALARRIL